MISLRKNISLLHLLKAEFAVLNWKVYSCWGLRIDVFLVEQENEAWLDGENVTRSASRRDRHNAAYIPDLVSV